jgi:hypothetical protein
VTDDAADHLLQQVSCAPDARLRLITRTFLSDDRCIQALGKQRGVEAPPGRSSRKGSHGLRYYGPEKTTVRNFKDPNAFLKSYSIR